MTSIALSRPLDALKAAAKKSVDAEAEAARRAWLTPGSGQAQEYRLTEQQARAYRAAGYPKPFDAAAQAAYGFVHAEMLALSDVGLLSIGTQTEMDAAAALVTDEIITEADACAAAGETIKRLRRRAKIRIAAATSAAEVRAAAGGIVWPQP